jgi:hypothetical protein
MTSPLPTPVSPTDQAECVRLVRRTTMQGDGAYYTLPSHPAHAGSHPPGTIDWSEHLEIWQAYDKRYHCRQSAEIIAERGGFGFAEATDLLGHEPMTWEPRQLFAVVLATKVRGK